MYFKGQSFGSSCYRLLSKNGEFVYMRTHGYLQLNPVEDTIESFICVNTLVSPEEGKKEIIEMKKRFTPLIVAASEPGIAAITNYQSVSVLLLLYRKLKCLLIFITDGKRTYCDIGRCY